MKTIEEVEAHNKKCLDTAGFRCRFGIHRLMIQAHHLKILDKVEGVVYQTVVEICERCRYIHVLGVAHREKFKEKNE